MTPRSSFLPPKSPARVILDTDMATDCDDAGALAVLHALASTGEAEILGIVANNRDGASIGAVAAINAFYGRDEIPLGAYQGDAVGIEAAAFVRELAQDTAAYGHRVTNRMDVPSAVEIYRKLLGAAPDHSVVIVSIGHLNNLADLLDSVADAHSDLSGPDLLRLKTPHLVVMGGDYPSGKEHNFFARGSAPFSRRVVETWPTPILFSGYGLGERVVTGPELVVLPESHPVRRAYAGHGSRPLERGRPSWDQTAVLAAVRGVGDRWGISEAGTNTVGSGGDNRWEATPDGSHYYLIEKRASMEVAREIGRLMLG